MVIEINGVKYQQKEQPKRKPMSKTMAALLMMASAFGSLDPYAKKPKKTPQVDIVKEYGLIQQKKSNLSKSQRDWVVWQFEKHFERVPS
jgi:hypothetical protein